MDHNLHFFRGGTAMANLGFVKEWKGHRGNDDGGGVLTGA
jgi:ribosome assembly protein SQT1